MQTASAFQRVESSVAFFINYYSKFAEWKAAMDRVWQLEGALERVDRTDLANASIVVTRDQNAEVGVRDLALARTFEISPDETATNALIPGF